MNMSVYSQSLPSCGSAFSSEGKPSLLALHFCIFQLPDFFQFHPTSLSLPPHSPSFEVSGAWPLSDTIAKGESEELIKFSLRMTSPTLSSSQTPSDPATASASDTTRKIINPLATTATAARPRFHHRTQSLPHSNIGTNFDVFAVQPIVSATTTPATSSSSSPRLKSVQSRATSLATTPNSPVPNASPIIKEKLSHRKKSTAVPTKPPRPPNAWILYRSNCAKTMLDTDPHAKWSQGELSKLFAARWREETPEVRLFRSCFLSN